MAIVNNRGVQVASIAPRWFVAHRRDAHSECETLPAGGAVRTCQSRQLRYALRPRPIRHRCRATVSPPCPRTTRAVLHLHMVGQRPQPPTIGPAICQDRYRPPQLRCSAGCKLVVFSKSSEQIHSPRDLVTPFARSATFTSAAESIVAALAVSKQRTETGMRAGAEAIQPMTYPACTAE